MKIISLSFLAVMVYWAVGVVSADMATSKIPNRKILLGCRFLLAALAAGLVVTWLGYRGAAPDYLRWDFYPLFALHVLLSVLAAILLWYSEIWPAGDAKFFMLISSALPLINPQIRNFPSYLFLSLLTNIFIMAAFVVVGGFLASGMRSAAPAEFFGSLWAQIRKKISGLNLGRNRLTTLAYPFQMIFIFLMQQVFMSEFKGAVGGVFLRVEIFYFFIFILWDKIGGFFKEGIWYYFTACCYLIYFGAGYFLFYDRLTAMLLAAILNVLKFSLLMVFGRAMLGFLMEKKDLAEAGAGELEPGMVLSGKETRRLRANPVFEGAFDDSFRDGLVAEQVGLLKDWLKTLPPGDAKVEIVRGRPFALWIAAGAAAALLLDRNLAYLFK